MYGVIAGFICGFLGAGGGLLLVPFFEKKLKLTAVESRASAIMIIASFVCISSIFYYKNSNIDIKIAVLCTVGGIVGSFIGTKILNKIKSSWLSFLFVIFVYYSGLRMIF